jgi:isocitrate dehydrogenase
MFEAIHGSAPDIAGKNIANPSGLINAAVAMLAHVGKTTIADTIKNAWLATIEEGFHTADIYQEGISKQKVSTSEFAEKVILNLGEKPKSLIASKLNEGTGKITIPKYKRKEEKQILVGVDVFINWKGSDPEEIGHHLSEIDIYKMKLKMITNRGVKVFPNGLPETYCTDHWRCRFVATESNTNYENLHYAPVIYEQVIALLHKLHVEGFEVIKTENLYKFDGRRAFSLGQGE